MDAQTATLYPSDWGSITVPLGAPPGGIAKSALCALLGINLESEAAERNLREQLAASRLGPASSLFRALRVKHPPTAKHCLRVSLGCSTFASALGLAEVDRSRMEIAALLHDLGKIGVPDHILNKPSRLDPDESLMMDQHRGYGVQILEACCGEREVLEIVACAPIWYDGSRPERSPVHGNSLPLGARIVAILDAFDAMTTDVVYRRALPRERAIAELFSNSPAQFDPELVREFSRVFSRDQTGLYTEASRRWVETACGADSVLWSLQSPLVPHANRVESIFQHRLLEAMHDGVAFIDVSGRVLVWNRGAERLTGLSPESVCHNTWQPQTVDMRDMEGNAVKHKNCPVARCLRSFSQAMHRMTITNQQRQRVAVNVHVVPVLDEAGTCHGATLLLHDVSPETSLEERVQNLHEKATTDPLTGIGNRAEFDRKYEEFVSKHLETGVPCSLVISDIDRFKKINDDYGHQAGDEALVDFARLIQTHLRTDDVLARYGGEEFVLLCPNCNNGEATRKAEEIRRELARTPQSALNGGCMTASFGVTELQAGDSPETLLRRADRALYQAKESGRNRVVQLGSGMAADKSRKKSGWWNWGSSSHTDSLIRRTLRTDVPLNVAAEKVRGFVSDQEAEIVEIQENFVVLCMDERHLPLQRRKSDRPTSMIIELCLQEDVKSSGAPQSSTLVDVTIRPKRSRDRRSDAVARADQLLNSLKSYLIAQEV